MKTFIKIIALLFTWSVSFADELPLPQQQNSQSSALIEYVSKVTQAIQQEWHYDSGLEGSKCKVYVMQSDIGEVIGFKVIECASEELEKSILRAIFKASPLPLPPEPSVFNPRLALTFVVPNKEQSLTHPSSGTR